MNQVQRLVQYYVARHLPCFAVWDGLGQTMLVTCIVLACTAKIYVAIALEVQ